MSCIGNFCSKRNACKNFWVNHPEQGIHQYIDWSAMGHGSCYTDPNGKMQSEYKYDCGDYSPDYEHFVPLEGENHEPG